MTNLHLKIKKKRDLFSSYFVEQYTPYANNSEHPSTLTVYTKLLLESLTFLLTTLVMLSEKVAHEHD